MKIQNYIFIFIAIIFGALFSLPPTSSTPSPKLDVPTQNPVQEKPQSNIAEQTLVTRVIDGDTLVVKLNGQEERVRLLGVDAAEIDYQDKVRTTKRECYALEAKDSLTKLTLNKVVTLKPDHLNQNRDKYNRLLRYVYLPNGDLVNQTLISTGATRYLAYFKLTLSSQFAQSEKQARENNLGLWAVCPW